MQTTKIPSSLDKNRNFHFARNYPAFNAFNV